MSTLLKPANLRLDLSRRMMSEAPLTEEESQNQAATKLQSSYRGKLSRKQHSFSSPSGGKPALSRATTSASPMNTATPPGSSTHRAPPPMKRANTTSKRLSFEAASEGEFAPAPAPCAAVLDRGIYQRLRTLCELPRDLPTHPESLKLDLAKRKVFSRPEDELLCSQLFEDLFDESAYQKELVLTGLALQWTAVALRNFVRLLPEFKRCILVDLTDTTTLGNNGCKAICDVLRLGDDGMSSLVELRLQRCGILNEGALELARTLPDAPEPLVSVDMNGNLLGSTTLFKLQDCCRKRRGLVVKCASKSNLQSSDSNDGFDGKLGKQELSSDGPRHRSGNEIIAKLLG